jgi:hypothetical protein
VNCRSVNRPLGAVIAATVCFLLGWVALVAGDPVPVLAQANLGFHELGHLLTYPLPDLVTAVMGSVVQVAVPLGLAAYFGWARHDPVGIGVCLAWAGASVQEVSVYVADAPYERLVLIGGEHDWAFILGRVGALDAADEIAAVLVATAWALVLGGLGSCLWAIRRRRAVGDDRPATTPITSRPISWQ